MRTFLEALRVLIVLPQVEFDRRRSSLHHAVGAVRRRAAGRRVRSPESRARLQRAIAIVDARLPAGPNCVRRTLLEMALDRGAAKEKLLAGFQAGGGPKSGHAWLESGQTDKHYDAVIAL